MRALPLDPGDYGGTYKLVGGRVSLDFINTISWPDTDRVHDWFDRPANVIDWAIAVEFIDRAAGRYLAHQAAADARAATRALGQIRVQRATVCRVLSPLAHGETPAPETVERLNAALAGICGSRVIDPTTLERVWKTPRRLDEVTRPVIADAAEVLSGTDRTRLGQCPSCGWLFYDTTRNRSRRWCDMADCGSRDKALRYYHRRHGNDRRSDRARSNSTG